MYPFVMGWLFGLSIAMPFGPVSMMCFEHSLSRGMSCGLARGAGAATMHGIYATLAAAAASTVAGPLMGVQSYIQLLSGFILACLGIRTILRQPNVSRHERRSAGHLADYLGGLGLALSNPMTLLPYVSFAGSIVLASSGTASVLAMAVIGVWLGTLSWYSTISGSAWLLRARLPPTMLTNLNLISGALLLGMGVLTALR